MKRFDQVNVIPFIDIMLVLLAIVLTTATFISQEKITLDLPEADSAEQTELRDTVEITIDAEGKYTYRGESIEPQGLATRLSGLERSTAILLYVDRAARFERFVTVIDLLKARGLDQLSIMVKGGS